LVNGLALEMPAGSYKLSFPATRLEPIRVRIEGGKLLPIQLSDAGKLRLPVP
jgi:hypothetical protein